MFGLFLMLPVLALYARGMPDYSPELLGFAMGAYGLTQAILQIPFGRWSDRIGRKPVIVGGLTLFAAGSLLGALAQSLTMLAVARSLQGAGALSAAVTALLADLTRPEVRTRAMAFIGISIGLSFVLSLVLGPLLDASVGVPGIFVAMLLMALAGILLIVFAVPAEPPREAGGAPPLERLFELTVRPSLLRLHLGMFAMHFMITATFLAVPAVLVEKLGLPPAGHWKVYLGVFVASIAGTVPLVLATERSSRAVGLLVFAIVAAAASQAMLGLSHGHFWLVMAALTVFFAAFNYLEARLPALLTLESPGVERGAALGIFATAQFLGAFAGGAVGGVLLGRFGQPGVFWGAAAVAAGWAGILILSAGAAAKAVEPG
jgi:predicted MFS family arabinose efflux permease